MLRHIAALSLLAITSVQCGMVERAHHAESHKSTSHQSSDNIVTKDEAHTRTLTWTNYQLLEEINDWIDDLVAAHPNVVSTVIAGSTHEGREIKGVKISRNSGNHALLLEGGMIGADWLSPTVLTYVIDQLVNNADSTIRQLTLDSDWYIFPVTNPDGYEYTHNFERLWIKNRYPVSGNDVGIDLTRNWNSHWGVVGADFNRSSDNYVSIGPFSEIETRTFSDFIQSISGNLRAFLSFRTFGQKFSIPFGHTSEHIYNYDDMYTIATRAMQALSQRYGTVYEVGTPAEVNEAVSGTAMDWVKYRFNLPVVGTYYLRDQGAFGYTLPVVQISPTCEETMDSIVSLVNEAHSFGYL